MRDLDMYVMRCYDTLLRRAEASEEELCACAKLVEQDDAKQTDKTQS